MAQLWIAKCHCETCGKTILSTPATSSDDAIIDLNQNHEHRLMGDIEVFKKKEDPLPKRSATTLQGGVTLMKPKGKGR